MTNLERKWIHVRVLRMLDERAALPWWAWSRRWLLTQQMHILLDSAL